MDKRTEKRFITFLAAAIIISVLLASLSLPTTNVGPEKKEKHEEEGPPDDLGVDIGYLDDTRQGENYTWTALISSTYDMGVLWVDNTGNKSDVYTINVTETPEGWSVSQDKRTVEVNPEEDLGVVLLTYNVPSGASGTHPVNISVESQTDHRVHMEMTILCEVEGTGEETTMIADTIMVDYSLTDDNGTALDEGSLPVTAGEIYVGQAKQLGYIDGFYLATLGLRLPFLGAGGETKVARLPPALAYGEKTQEDGGHELGGVTLLFTITVTADIPDPGL